MRRRISTCVLAGVFTVVALGGHAGSASPRRGLGVRPVVIAVLEPGGLNVLHEDFRAQGKVSLPPGMPRATDVALPTAGTFEERLAAAEQGPLGALNEKGFYRVAGTRIAGIYVPEGEEQESIFDHRSHGTGVASSAVGIEHGTAPHALLVYVTDTSPDAWRWVAEQAWIDLVSTSYHTIESEDPCYERRFVQELVSEGRVVFSAAGNGDMSGLYSTPSGVPEAYTVGGVDDEGRTFQPRPDAANYPTRPYETGDLFVSAAAGADSLEGSMQFGGTSGATPLTAGRAATLVAYARGLLGARSGTVDGKLAAGRSPVATGPLADGDLTAAELTDLLHHVAVPAETVPAARYALEGFGALTPDAIALARDVLAGAVEEPVRAQEDAVHAQVEAARDALLTAKCR